MFSVTLTILLFDSFSTLKILIILYGNLKELIIYIWSLLFIVIN